jgi:hypothetical protein
VDTSGIEVRGRDREAPLIEAPIVQRSQGMRMFAALLAFVYAQTGDAASRPVLLIDEAEQHLHYDGQAHLVQVLGRQRVAQWVLYTTHSVGCLPEDLGTGLVVIEPLVRASSRISQSFWTAGSALRPIMLALGATALSFTPSRRVVIGEGAHEAILLPTLLRQSRTQQDEDSPLGFQVVGGLSEVRPSETELLEEEGGTVVYLVDGDQGGLAHADKVPKAARSAGRVLMLGGKSSGLSIEDCVDSKVLVAVVNRLLADKGKRQFKPAKRSIPPIGRAAWVQGEISARGAQLSRTRIAQELALEATERPIVEKARVALLRDLLASINALFPS